MTASSSMLERPSEALSRRLDDPKVAASVGSLLDNADLLAVLVTGLQGFVARGDTVIASVSSAVHELRGASGAGDLGKQLAEMRSLVDSAKASLPVLQQLVDSGLVRPEILQVLAMVGDAAVEGVGNAKTRGSRIEGVRGLLKTLKDQDVQRGLGVLIEVAKALGRRSG